MTPGQLLGLCREIKGMTLREVEQKTGISNKFLNQCELDKRRMSFENVITICRFYGVSIDRLAKCYEAPSAVRGARRHP